MAFDPSVISEIGGSGPDVAGAVAKGYSLKNMIDQNTLDSYELRRAKQQDSDSQSIRAILKGQDLSSAQGRSQAVSALSQKGFGAQAMSLMQQGQSLESGELSLQRERLASYQAALDFHSTLFDPIYQQATAMRDAKTPDGKPQYNDAQITAFISSQAPTVIKAIQDAPNDALTPELKAQALKHAQGNVGRAITYDELQRIEAQTQQGRERLKMHQDQLNSQSEIKTRESALAETQRHDRATEDAARERAQSGRYGVKDPVTDAGQKLKDDFVTSIGGKVTLAQLRSLDFDRLASNGVSASYLRQKGLTQAGALSAATAEGRRAGNVAILEGSVKGAADQVSEALKGVTRSNFTSLNRAIAAGKTQFGNAAESRYAAAVQSLINEYSKVIGGGSSQTTDSARREAQNLLSTAASPAQVAAVLGQMEREVDIVRAAAGSALSGSAANPPVAPVSAPVVPVSGSSAGPPNSGKRLTYDPSTGQIR